MPDKKPNIYPPSIIDPLLPGGIPKQPDPEGAAKADYLGKLARENMGVDPAEPGGDRTVHIKFTVSDAPCSTCGQHKVLPGESCPGCGAVR
ncbi:MAG: hypothetical protein M0T69_02060 [Deltaproteobacteria bacterium]|nr:hypothetical protein [Deltaproteobacteria bacterium]